MALDFSVLTQTPSIGARYAEGLDLARADAERNMLRQQQMEQMQFQRRNMLAQEQERQAIAAERQRATQQQNALTEYVRSGMPQGVAGLAQFGEAGLKTAKALREERVGALDEERKKLEYVTQRLASATPETYGAIRSDLGRISPEFVRALPTEYNAEHIGGLVRQGLALKDQLDLYKPMTVAPGASVFNPRTGQPMYTAPAAPEKGYEPTELEKLQNALSALPQGDPRRAAYENRIRMLTTREPKEPRQEPAPTITQIQSPTDPTQMLTIDARVYRGGGLGSPGVIGTTGKTAPVAAAEQKKLEGQQAAADIIDTLRAAYQDLDQRRAVPSEQRSVLSNLTSYIASTGVGQVAGRMAGTPEQTQRDVIQSARNQILNAVKNATGMSAQQLNSNVEFKSWVESLTDPTKSYQANTAILDNLEKFIASGGKYSARKGGNEVTPTPGAPARGAGIEAERANARAAIAAGAPEAAVRKRFKEKTGQEL